MMLHVETEEEDRKPRSDRLEARISSEQKALFERAAALQGRSLSDFVLGSAREAAMRTIQEHEALNLSRQDREAFVSALLRSTAPSKRLRQAAVRYKRAMGR